MSSIRPAGPLGTGPNTPVIDPYTSPLNRNPNPGAYCASRDPSLLAKIANVMQAWELAKTQYAPKAIVTHAGGEIYEVVKGFVPALLSALTVVISTTIIGAMVGGLATGGVGAGAGAAAGFGVGLFILKWLGLGFLAVYIGGRIGEVGGYIYTGARMAWNARDCQGIEQAAHEMAQGIGVFFAILVQGIFLYAGDKGAAKAIAQVQKSKLGVNFARWLETKFSLNGKLKAVAKPAGEYQFTTDTQGRPILAEGWLLKATSADNPAAHAQVTQGLKDFHAGHLIPRIYNGPSSLQNLVPTSARMNTSYIKSVENMITRHATEGAVYLQVIVKYDGTSKIPSSVQHKLYKLVNGKMEPIPGGDVTTNNLGNTPGVPMGQIIDQVTGKPIKPKDFLSTDPTKGVSGKLPN